MPVLIFRTLAAHSCKEVLLLNNIVKEQNIELNRLYKKQTELYHAAALQCGLSDAAFWILYSLCESDDIYTQNALSETWSLPKQTVNSAISSLVRSGYICLRPIASARNSKAVVLTDEGMELCRHTVIPILEAEERALSRMSDEERRLFLSLSDKQYQLTEEEFQQTFKTLKHKSEESDL